MQKGIPDADAHNRFVRKSFEQIRSGCGTLPCLMTLVLMTMGGAIMASDDVSQLPAEPGRTTQAKVDWLIHLPENRVE